MAYINIQGLDELEKDILKCASSYPKVTRKFLNKEGNNLRKVAKKIAKERVKKKTGNYMKGFDKDRPFVGKNVSLVKVYNQAPHGHLIEYGTVRRDTKTGANRGFMKGAHVMEAAMKEYEKEFSKHVADALLDDLLKEGAF